MESESTGPTEASVVVDAPTDAPMAIPEGELPRRKLTEEHRQAMAEGRRRAAERRRVAAEKRAAAIAERAARAQEVAKPIPHVPAEHRRPNGPLPVELQACEFIDELLNAMAIRNANGLPLPGKCVRCDKLSSRQQRNCICVLAREFVAMVRADAMRAKL